MTTSELLHAMQSAISEAEKAHKDLEDAEAKLQPLREVAEEADKKAGAFLVEYQRTSHAASGIAQRFEKIKEKTGRHAKRGPRDVQSVLQASATRALNDAHKAGTTKKTALAQVMDKVRKMAEEKGEKIGDMTTDRIASKAATIWHS